MFINNKIDHIKLALKLKKAKIHISYRATIKNSFFDGYNYVRRGSTIINSKIGMGTYIRNNCYLDRVKIGKYCSIAPNVKIVSGNHPTQKFVCMHPAFYSGKEIAGLNFNHSTKFEEYTFANDNFLVEIGNDVWIGENVVILNGVKIEDGAVIATGAVVTHDVLAYSIVGGVPAKIIKYRFSNRNIVQLKKIRWWNKSIEWITQNINYFDDVNSFIEKFL